MVRFLLLERMMVDQSKINIERDAAYIAKSADEVAHLILQHRSELDRSGQAGRPLAVILGELHGYPGYYLHHTAVIARMPRNSVAVGIEQQHNFLLQAFEVLSDRKPTSEEVSHIKTVDCRGAFSMAATLGMFRPQQACYTSRALGKFLTVSNIPVRLTDVAYSEDDGSLLDIEDPSTSASINKALWFGKFHSRIGFKDRKGMLVRNHHMASQLLDFGRELNAKILIQPVGDGHVLEDGQGAFDSVDGYNCADWKGKDMLCAHFKKMGAAVLVIAPYSQAREQDPSILKKSRLDASECHLMHRPSMWRALYDPIANNGYGWDNLCSWEEEASYAGAVFKRLGLDAACIEEGSYSDFRMNYVDRMKFLFCQYNPA